MLNDEFETFVIESTPSLLGLARSISRNEHDAWDLLQDTFIRVGMHWQRVRRDGNPLGYARTTLVRLNIDRVRRLRREVLSRSTPEPPTSWEPSAPDLGWLPGAWQHLTPKQRSAIALRYLEDLDFEAIASILHCSAVTARSHVSRGLATLREQSPRAEEGAERHG